MNAMLLRALAILICVVGVIDPAITRVRAVQSEVSVVSASRLPDPSLTDRVVRALESSFTVVRGPSIGAAAVVSIGFQLPEPVTRPAERGFAVIPEPSAPFASVVSVNAPARAQLQARVSVAVRVQTLAARGKTLVVMLERDGVAVDRVTRDVSGDDTTEALELGLVANAAGDASYTVAASIEGAAADVARVDFTVRAGDERWAVLFFDPRPSWMSTFVRRAIESDPRFVVTSRVRTSRGASVSAGRPPETLASLPALDHFRAVFVGAPEELGDADVAVLESFMRRRGGSVGLLMDVVSAGRPFERLMGVPAWRHVNRAEPAGEPLASELLWPAAMPLWAEPLTPAGRATAAASAPAIWQAAIGRGRLIVSGALDAWRYRDRDAGGFDRFWRAAVAAAAAAAPADTDTAPAQAIAPARVGSANPGPERRPTPDDRALVRAWASSHHGEAIAEAQLVALAPAILRALSPSQERRTSHPMRSAWWIVPFALALGGEWWMRRRAGRR